MVEDGDFSHKIDYIAIFRRASKLHYWFKKYAILLNGWILPIGGDSAMEGLF